MVCYHGHILRRFFRRAALLLSYGVFCRLQSLRKMAMNCFIQGMKTRHDYPHSNSGVSLLIPYTCSIHAVSLSHSTASPATATLLSDRACLALSWSCRPRRSEKQALQETRHSAGRPFRYGFGVFFPHSHTHTHPIHHIEYDVHTLRVYSYPNWVISAVSFYLS